MATAVLKRQAKQEDRIMRFKRTNEAPATGPTSSLRELIRDDPQYTVGALVKLYGYQTADEQVDGETKLHNDVGFNGVDAAFLSSLAKWYLNHGSLTKKQLTMCKATLTKYVRQLERHGGVDPLPFSLGESKKREVRSQEKAATLDKDIIRIRFPFSPDSVAQVKALSGRRFNKDDPRDKHWTAPLDPDNVESLREWGFKIGPQLYQWYKRSTTLMDPNDAAIDIPGLQCDLYPFQRAGVSFIQSRDGRALIADEMGLGKTVQALGWLQLNPQARPAVIVVPASLKLNWQREAEKWMKEPHVVVLNGRPKRGDGVIRTAVRRWGKDVVYVVNYDIMANATEKVASIDFPVDTGMRGGGPDVKKPKRVEVPETGWTDVLLNYVKPTVTIMDECHYIKNPKAARSKAVIGLGKPCKHVIGLSGTPITNRPVEFHPTISLIAPQLFPSFWRYAQEYCGARHNGFGWDFGGATNTEKLHQKLTRTIMMRRLKCDVMKELPPKVRSVIPLEIENRREYNRAQHDFLGWLEGVDPKKMEAAKRAEALVSIEKLKQLTIKGKMKACIQWVTDFLDNDEKLVLFGVHKATINRVMDEFKGYHPVKIDGSVSSTKRQRAVDTFQEKDRCRLFVGNIKAAGVGLTLTAASSTAFLELGWTPGEHDQAEDRVHRIGQLATSVNAYYLLADQTVETKIAELLDEKRKVLAAVLDGKTVDEQSMLTELLYAFQEAA